MGSKYKKFNIIKIRIALLKQSLFFKNMKFVNLKISDHLMYKFQFKRKIQQQQMLSEILVSLVLIGVVTLAYTFYIKPKSIMKNYAKILRSKGFKVLEIPFNPLKNNMIETLRKGTLQGDAMKLYKQYQGYDVIVSNILAAPKLEIINPDFIKQFFAVDKHYEYPKQQKIVSIFSRAAGHGLPLSQGKTWKRKRTILNKVFNFDFVKSQTSNIEKICSEAIQQLQKQSQKIDGTNIVKYNILDLTVKMFSGVMMASFLGGNTNEMINGQPAGKFLKQLVADLSSQSFYPINFLLGVKIISLGFTKQQRDIQNRVQIYRKWGLQFIKKRINQINAQLDQNKDKKVAGDIIEALLMSKRNVKGAQAQDQISTQEQIFQEFNAFFVAGTDTTSTFTEMMIYSIAKHPEVQAKVRSQIQKYMKEDNYSYENLKNFTYIDNLQKQTTRCFGPGTHLFSRKAKVDNYLNGIPIKKGTGMSIMVMTNHFDQKYFKEPTKFRPQRWESECDNLHPFVFGGFSGGARTCIGKHLAMLESKIALIKFMKRYEKIELQKPNFKMIFQFLYTPEKFDTKMTIKQQ